MQQLLLLRWLRRCGHPVIPHEAYNEFLALDEPGGLPTQQILAALTKIPTERRALAFFVLDIVASDKSPHEASQVWGPCLLARRVETPSQVVTEAAAVARVCMLLVPHRRQIAPPRDYRCSGYMLKSDEASVLSQLVRDELQRVGGNLSCGLVEATLAEPALGLGPNGAEIESLSRSNPQLCDALASVLQDDPTGLGAASVVKSVAAELIDSIKLGTSHKKAAVKERLISVLAELQDCRSHMERELGLCRSCCTSEPKPVSTDLMEHATPSASAADMYAVLMRSRTEQVRLSEAEFPEEAIECSSLELESISAYSERLIENSLRAVTTSSVTQVLIMALSAQGGDHATIRMSLGEALSEQLLGCARWEGLIHDMKALATGKVRNQWSHTV